MKFYRHILRVVAAVTYHLNEFDEVVHLIWIADEWIDDSDLLRRTDILSEQVPV